MRMMLRWTVPVERGNEAIHDGSIASPIEHLMATLQPEAAYFLAQDGERSGMLFFDMKDPAQIPRSPSPCSRTWTRRWSSRPS